MDEETKPVDGADVPVEGAACKGEADSGKCCNGEGESCACNGEGENKTCETTDEKPAEGSACAGSK